MQYAAHLPRLPSARTIVAPVVALVVGAAAATGAYSVIDDGDETVRATKPIVIEMPAPGDGVRGINDMAQGERSAPQRVYINPSTGHASPSGDVGEHKSTGSGSSSSRADEPTEVHPLAGRAR